jgi:hypothetical protein
MNRERRGEIVFRARHLNGPCFGAETFVTTINERFFSGKRDDEIPQ